MKEDLVIGLVLSGVGFALPCNPFYMFIIGLALCIAGGFYLGSAFAKHKRGIK